MEDSEDMAAVAFPLAREACHEITTTTTVMVRLFEEEDVADLSEAEVEAPIVDEVDVVMKVREIGMMLQIALVEKTIIRKKAPEISLMSDEVASDQLGEGPASKVCSPWSIA